MDNSTWWWLAAGGLVAIELISGTFYLLMLALGLGAGAVAAHAGLALAGQMLSSAAVGIGAVAWLHYVYQRRPSDPSPRADRSVNLDIGEVVQIETWQADGTASVKYRGTQWTAIHRPHITPMPGPHRVAELIGNRLLVDKV